jgi:hypothetical protein
MGSDPLEAAEIRQSNGVEAAACARAWKRSLGIVVAKDVA